MTPSTTTDRIARTRVRVSPGVGGGRCRVRTSVSVSDPTVPCIRPVVTAHDARSVRLAMVPEGALLLAGDAVEIDVSVDAGATVEIIEPGGTVAFDMRGDSARWQVAVQVADGACLTWAGKPFVVSQGAVVDRATRVRVAEGGRLAMREVLVLGRFGEQPGAVRQTSTVLLGRRPVLVEDLPVDADTAGSLLGGHRVLASVLTLGSGVVDPPEHRYDLAAPDAVLWRRLGLHAHETDVDAAWASARSAVLSPAPHSGPGSAPGSAPGWGER